MPGTKNAETYTLLDFYAAVMGNSSSKNIEITTPRNEDNTMYAKYCGLQASILYTDIEQVAGGMERVWLR